MNRLMTYRPLVWPVVILFSALLAGLLMLDQVSSPLRFLAAFWFLLVCPGMAYVRLLRLHDPLIEATLAIALSAAIDTLVAETLVLADAWSPGWALAIIVLITIPGAAVQLRQYMLPARGEPG